MGIVAAGSADHPSLERRARPGAFVEVVGERMALLGREEGVFELWMWPLQALRDLVLRPVSEAVERRTVRVLPEGLEVEEAGSGWRLRQELFACRERRGVVVLLSLASERPLELELSFTCSFRPMWPAGLGGEIAVLDEETGALLVTEELGRFALLAGVTGGAVAAQLADHALPAGRVRIAFTLEPGEEDRAVVLAGAEREPEPLSAAALLGREQAAVGLSRAQAVVRDARELWSELRTGARRELERSRAHWRAKLGAATRLVSSDPALERAFRWSHVALERAWVRVDGLGRGLVAGLAPAGHGTRPGYGWFFDGDALIAARALADVGDFDGAAEVLRFAAAHQREDGKLMHELTLSARLCDWVGSYPYAYYKGLNNADFVTTLAHVLAASGDARLRDDLAGAAERALRWSASCVEESGRMSNAKAGIAAVEAGPLSDRIESETHLQGAWLAALAAGARLAADTGREELAADVARWRRSAEKGLETFWSGERGRYAFAHLSGGELLSDLSVFLARPLTGGCGAPARALATARVLNRPELTADWGVRMFATDSAVYDPEHYNDGSVFPHLTGFATLAQFRHGLLHSGFQLLASQVALVGFGALGMLEEHLVGDRARVPARGVPHQIFSSAAIVDGMVHGLFGFAPDAEEGSALLRPHLPPAHERLGLANLRVGGTRFDVTLTRERGSAPGPSRLSLVLEHRSGPPLDVRLEPLLPALTRLLEARVDEEPVSATPRVLSSGALAIRIPELHLASTREVRLSLEEGPAPLLSQPALDPGEPSRAPRIVELGHEQGAVEWELFGPAGTEAVIPLVAGFPLAVEGASFADGALRLSFPPAATEFSSVRVRVRPAP